MDKGQSRGLVCYFFKAFAVLTALFSTFFNRLTLICAAAALGRLARKLERSFLQAYTEGLHRFMSDRDLSVQALKKYLRVDDKELLDGAYSFYAQRLQKIPYPTLKGIKFILDEMAERNPQAKKATPESFVELSVLQELDQTGFFKQLWKN